MIPSRFVFAVGFFCSYASFSTFQSFGLAIKRDDDLKKPFLGQAFRPTPQEKFLYCGMGVPPVLKMVQNVS